MNRRFFTLDVFTQSKLSGNPLAVVVDGSGFSDQQMQKIAAEFNLSETVFVTSTSSDFRAADIRIFTPKNELPFAGHPTIGTAILLAGLSGLSDGEQCELVLNEKVGPVKCKVANTKNVMRASFKVPKLPTRQVFEPDHQLLAGALGILPEDFQVEGHQPSVCDSGVPFPIIAINSLEAISAINVNESKLEECFSTLGFALELLVYCKQTSDKKVDYHVRLFAPAMGIAEDPATGSAAAAFAAQIMACDQPEDGTHDFVIEQGIEMGRPSRIELMMEVRDGALVKAAIGGAAVIVSEGKLLL